MQPGANNNRRYPLLTNLRKMKVKKQRAGAIQATVNINRPRSGGSTRRMTANGASEAAPKLRRKMKTMVKARAIEVAGEELNTMPFEGTNCQSELKAPK